MNDKLLKNILANKRWLRKDSKLFPYNNSYMFTPNKPISEESISSIINVIEELCDIGEEVNGE